MAGGGSSGAPSNDPWKGQAPYLRDIFAQAQGLYNAGPQQAYQGPGVAAQSPYTQLGTQQLGDFGGSGYNAGVVGNAANSINTFGQAQDPSKNPLSQVGYALAPGSADFLNQTQQRAGGDFSLFPNIDKINNYIATPQTSQVGPLASEGFGANLDPTSTLNRLQTAGTNVNVQNSPTTAGENLSAATGAGTANALNSQLNMTPGSSPYIDELVQRSLAANTKNFNQSVLPQIANASDIQGGYGGSRQGTAQGIAVSGLNDTNANTAAQLYSQQYNNDLARQLQAAGLGTSAAATGGAQTLARTGQDQNFALNTAQLQGQDLNRQLSAATGAGQLALGGDQTALARAQLNNQSALNAGQFDLQRAGLGINAGGMENQYIQGAVGQGLTAAQTGLDTLQAGTGQALDAAKSGLALGGAAQDIGLGGAKSTLAAGSGQDQYQQQLIADLMQKYYFNQQAPTDSLKNYQQIVGGTSAISGGQPGPQSGGLSGAVGGASAATGALGALAAANIWNPGGWVAGGIIGLSALAGYYS